MNLSFVVKILGFFIVYVSTACTVFGIAQTPRNEVQDISWREVFVTVDSDMQDVKEYKGHALGMMRQRGFAFYGTGREDKEETAVVNVLLNFERSGGKTSYLGYAVYRFDDGSTKVGRFDGQGDPGGLQSGEFELVKGTGRFEGISGEGTFEGRGFPPYGDIYLDVQGTYSISE